MMIALPRSKLHSLTRTVRERKEKEQTTVRDLAHLLGSMVAAHPAILPAPLYYRNLERAWSKALQSGLTYDSNIAIDRQMSSDLQWWATQCSQHNSRSLHICHWDFVMAFNTGLGSELRRCDHREPLDSCGEVPSHQLSGASGIISSPEIICSLPSCGLHPSSPGQHHSDSIHQQNGWNPLSDPVGTCAGDLEMVSGERDNDTCRTPTRVREHLHRLGVPSCEGLQRLEAKERDIPTA